MTVTNDPRPVAKGNKNRREDTMTNELKKSPSRPSNGEETRRLRKEAEDDDYEEKMEDKTEDLFEEKMDDEDEDDMVEKSLNVSRIEKLLEKTATVVEGLAKRSIAQDKRLDKLTAKFEALGKEYPVPEGSADEGIEHDPTAMEEENVPAPEAATKPATTTTGLAGAVVGKAQRRPGTGLQSSVSKADIEKMIDLKMKAMTPGPTTGDGRMFAKSYFGKMREAVKMDREICGLRGGDNFGVSSGRGDDSARFKMAQFMQKQNGGY